MTGVVPENPGGRVLSVETGSPTWRDDIRAGDQVVVLDTPMAAGTYSLATRGRSSTTSRKDDQIQDLRSYRPVVRARTRPCRHRWPARLSRARSSRSRPADRAAPRPPAVLSSSDRLAGLTPGWRDLFVGAALAAVAFGRWREGSRRPRGAWRALAAAWVVSISRRPRGIRRSSTSQGRRQPPDSALVGFAIVADRRRIMAFLSGRSGPQFVDLLYLGLAVAILIGGFLGNNPLPAIVVTVAAVLVYPFWRHATVSSFERLGRVAGTARRLHPGPSRTNGVGSRERSMTLRSRSCPG